jgi:hypothetical protein
MNEVDSILRGEKAADDFLETLRQVCSDGDELFRIVKKLSYQEDEPMLKAFCRDIQKQRLERTRG